MSYILLKRPLRKVVEETSRQAQTYRVWVKLECGHETTFTVAGHHIRNGTYKRPKSIQCIECPHDRQVVLP
jgi:hypothetical protein